MPWKRSSSKKDEEGFMRKTSDTPNRWSMRTLVQRIKQIKNSDLNDTMVIGLDFGTTYSGAAWATVDDFENDQINLITKWPNHGREEGKAPTALYYPEGKEMQWGYAVPLSADPIKWFKLLLLKDEDLDDEIRTSDYVLRARKMLRELDKTPVDAVADYLSALWQHTLDTIHKSRSKSSIAALTFHVVITVPAIWKDYARTAMTEAATKAGILKHRAAGETTLSFVPEPEAAALVTLWEHRRDLRTGDLYVICDAGGGTVDLITYRVGALDPIELHEAVIGSGGLCGGIFIDEKFEAMCKKRLGLRWNNLSQAGIKAMTKGEWEDYIKPSFEGKSDRNEYIVQIPAEAFKEADMTDTSRSPVIKDGRFHFTTSDIQPAFSGSWEGIEKLISGQVKAAKDKGKSITGIVLVGGLGASPYLYNHLQELYGKKDIRIIQSSGFRPRTAICRGAIFKGFLDGPSAEGIDCAPVSVVSTIARQSIGVSHLEIFNPKKHSEKDKYYDSDEGVWRASKQMQWYLKKGDDVSATDPVRHSFYECYTNESSFQNDDGKQKILQCDEDVPPKTKNDRVKTLGTITYDMKSILTWDDLIEYEGKGSKRKLRRFDYDIVMTPSGASTEFALYYQDNIKLGAKKMQVEV